MFYFIHMYPAYYAISSQEKIQKHSTSIQNHSVINVTCIEKKGEGDRLQGGTEN